MLKKHNLDPAIKSNIILTLDLDFTLFMFSTLSTQKLNLMLNFSANNFENNFQNNFEPIHTILEEKKNYGIRLTTQL